VGAGAPSGLLAGAADRGRRAQNPALIGLGALLVAAAVAGALAGWRTDLAPSAVTGAGAGMALLAFAAWAAVAAAT
jgi:hypothetical protein